ncbi:MAG TPA: hypothetical protein VM534_06430 [Thermoanaerobaculia bacterium]|nr:hypothetical protein [Thermoanaerobaculia bacterium]
MVFRETLNAIAGRIPETMAISLLGIDGIAVESINPAGLPLESLSAELVNFFREIQMSNTELEIGEIEQFSLSTDKLVSYVSLVTSEYLILMVMSPGPNHGRVRFELKKARFALKDELT